MRKMSVIQKNKKVLIGALIILAAVFFIWSMTRNKQSHTEDAMSGSSVNESAADSNASIDNPEKAEDDKTVEEIGNEGADKTDTVDDQKQDDKKNENQKQESQRQEKQDAETEDDAAILENEGELEIVIPENMATDGF